MPERSGGWSCLSMFLVSRSGPLAVSEERRRWGSLLNFPCYKGTAFTLHRKRFLDIRRTSIFSFPRFFLTLHLFFFTTWTDFFAVMSGIPLRQRSPLRGYTRALLADRGGLFSFFFRCFLCCIRAHRVRFGSSFLQNSG